MMYACSVASRVHLRLNYYQNVGKLRVCLSQQSTNKSYYYLNRWFRQNSDSATTTTTDDHNDVGRRLSVSIVGTGPSGCYTAKYLRMAFEKEKKKKQQQQQHQSNFFQGLDIDMLESLPTPFGLVRSGVAPDHPEVKNVEHDFATLFQTTNDNDNDDNSSKNDNNTNNNTIQLYGNVTVGKDVMLEELRDLYDVVILAYGCHDDNKLGIPGEDDLKGVLSAREFVAWYNGHPDYQYMGDSILQELLSSSEKENVEVAVIGQGNVALDCARILAKGSKGLLDTDIASHALPLLHNGISKTTILGRRGHVQGAFTIKELRELTKLEKEGHDTRFIVRMDDLEQGMTESSKEELQSGPSARPKTRIDKLLREVASNTHTEPEPSKEIHLRFLLQPIRFLPDPKNPERLGSILCQKTRLEGPPGNQSAIPIEEMEEIPANMALVSIGYKGVPLTDMDKQYFDSKRGVVRNKHGKVADDNDQVVEYGLYVSGWLKRGPSGIIGTNIGDSKDTVKTIMSDLETIWELNDVEKQSRQGLVQILQKRNVQVVDWESYKIIDQIEKEESRFRSEMQPREKIVSIDEMIKIVQSQEN